MRRRLLPVLLPVLLAAMASHAAAAPEGKRSGAVLPGGDSKQPVNIEATKLDYFDKEQKLVYTGGVVATQGAAKLKASVMTILLAPRGGAKNGAAGGTSSNQVQHMVAAGPVTMIQHDQVGTGDNAVYDRAANTVVMTGNVTLSQGPNVTKGEKLVYDLKTGQAVVTGRVKSLFLPGSDAGPSAKKADEAGSGEAAADDVAKDATRDAAKRAVRRGASR